MEIISFVKNNYIENISCYVRQTTTVSGNQNKCNNKKTWWPIVISILVSELDDWPHLIKVRKEQRLIKENCSRNLKGSEHLSFFNWFK